MPAVVVFIVAAGAAAAAYAAPLEIALGVLLGSWLLVPGSLWLPGAPSLLLVDRLVLLAFVIGLVVRIRRGEVSVDSLRPTRIHVVLLVYLAASFATGVALAGSDVPLKASLHIWLGVLDQLVLFVVVLAVARTIGPRRVARTVVALVVVTAVIALFERVLGSGWSSWWFHGLPKQQSAPGAIELGTRGGSSRAQAAAQFPLEYGWVTAILLPLVAAVGLSSRRLLVRLAPALVLAGVVVSVSRSPVIASTVAALVLLVGVRFDLRIRLPLLIAAAIAVLLLVFVPSLTAPFSSASHSDSASIRVDRLPPIMQAVAPHPYQGLGLGALATRGLPGVDNSYVLLYAEIGILGLLAWLASLLTALGVGLAALRAPPGPLRAIAAGCLAGIALVPVAAASYDFASVLQSGWALWILVAVATAICELAPRKAPGQRRRWADRVLLPVAGFTAGAAVFALTPVHAASTYRFETQTAYWAATEPRPDEYIGRVLVNTACDVMAAAPRTDGVTISCRRMDLTQPAWQGVGEARIQGPTTDRVRATESELNARVHAAVPGFRVFPLGGIQSGRPTWAQTAPVWLAAGGLIVGLIAPAGRRRPDSERELEPIAAPLLSTV
jgi:hypothetical protein